MNVKAEPKKVTIELLTPVKPCPKTITVDNGKKFSQHESITKQLAIMTLYEKSTSKKLGFKSLNRVLLKT